MALQSSVGMYREQGCAGDRATPNQSVYYPKQLLADSSGVVAGQFCWIDNNGDLTQTAPSPLKQPVGLVERVQRYPNMSLSSGYSDKVPADYPVELAVKGDYWVKCGSANVSTGMAVFVGANGAIKAANSGSSVENYIETPWRVVQGATAANSLILISCWQNAAPLAAQLVGSVPVANGGTGVTAVGTANQVLATNAAASGTEWQTIGS